MVCDCGPAFAYFLVERHFDHPRCATGHPRVAHVCDALATPIQRSGRGLVFIELKTSGQIAKAKDQLRNGIRAVLGAGLEDHGAIRAEIWHTREPKKTLTQRDFIDVDGLSVPIRHRQSA